ncbi:hypothetical protein CVIRNUC_001474 [Coccomyxa viridis]|uniref:Phospholipid-transporting ATPase n=1 Tax=Coccomyxa viridis TaxID=1274662 RepID=A0AAV1HT49_9CHLO|nr:hypothetical protein CVIRNUC_001474 [Coccomyxa viridis]
MESRNSHETSSQGGDGSSHSSERSKLTIPEKIVQAGKEAVRKTKNLGRQKGSRRRQSTNPLALAATRVYRESIKASKTVLHIGSKNGHKEGKDGAQAEPWTIKIERGNEVEGHVPNSIRTAKYNAITFFPIFLIEMFGRVAYLYFLAQACLAWWNVVSPFGGWGSSLALGFVLVVAAIKAIWEDAKRHQEDRRTNASVAHRYMPDGTIQDIKWRDVRVGHILKVEDEELFPADLLCLYSALEDDACFIKTTNLDGESNLKIRRPLDLRDAAPEEDADVLDIHATLECEQPNADLHKFQGRLIYQSASEERSMPVTTNEMLLRGCMLKNSNYVLGLVVYTGKESRIQMNAAKTPNKVGSYDHFLNFQIGFIIILQLAMCVFCAVAAYIWRNHAGWPRYQLAMYAYVEGNFENGAAYTFILFITFWILYSYLVPISLFVTMEIVKFWQGFVYIKNDKDMVDPETGTASLARNTNLNEDLGKVEYVFSDKTGTLTANEMQLREVAIAGVAYGDSSFRLEEHEEVQGMPALERFDARLADAAKKLQALGKWEAVVQRGGSSEHGLSLASSQFDAEVYEELDIPESNRELSQRGSTPRAETNGSARAGSGRHGSQSNGKSEADLVVLGCHLVDFWINIALCQSLIVEAAEDDGPPIYQGPSPDEVALVEGGRQLGFEFVKRMKDTVVVNMLGTEAAFEILNVMEYSSARGRMSVIARAPGGSVRLLSKGSDAKVIGILHAGVPKALLDATNSNLHLFATQGLRTLAIGTRVMDEQWLSEWDARYQEAAALLDGRDEATEELMEEVETDLELVGVSAIEDKLQDGVPAAIQTLLDAGIKVWVITGDKQETAINIAISCKLIRNPDSLLICNASTREEAHARLRELQQQLRRSYAPVGGPKEGPPPDKDGAILNPLHVGELVIDGGTLSHILGTEMEQELARVGAQCGSVVICRSSPSQKAAIVHMMSEYEMSQAEGRSTGLYKWYKRQMRKQAGRMLSIGDGANDVAMLQAADVGIGIMGKEGRQAVNNSDYAIPQFRFLTRLLLVHGSLSAYRLSRLIKYSFYKNIAFGFLLFYYQFYCGFSGQSMVDDISAAAFNVVFTSLPILLFAVLDRPVHNLNTLLRFPQTYNPRSSLTTLTFWKNGVLMAAVDAAICFFIPFYATRTNGRLTMNDVFSVGKTVFTALLGSVTLEVALVSRYWTWPFILFVLLSYWLVYPFEILYALVEQALQSYDVEQFGVAQYLYTTGAFWFTLLACALVSFGHRLLERGYVWLFRPQDYFLLSEMEAQERQHKEPEMGWQTSARLTSLASHQFSRPGSERRSTMDSQVSESLLGSEYPQSPMAPRRRSRTVKRDTSLSRTGSLGPISRRGSLVGPDGLPRTPSRALSRDDPLAEAIGSSRAPLGGTIREEPSQDGSIEQKSGQRRAGSGAGAGFGAREIELPPHSTSRADRKEFYHS